MKVIKAKMYFIIDYIISPFVLVSAIFFYLIRRVDITRIPFSKRILLMIGIFPIKKHYYEPLFDARNFKNTFSLNRLLPGIDWNEKAQLDLLNKFNYNEEITHLSSDDEVQFNFKNAAFESGDAEYWYNIIRHFKPKIIIEIGCGYSTIITAKAIKKNIERYPGYKCEHICIEPYEAPWLEKMGVQVIRMKVEDVDKGIFKRLSANDILFIDSSHIIRPRGDILFLYLEILPVLKKGVIVHVHDIFSPKDYPEDWIVNAIRFWNEQYLLEGFLTLNNSWEIIGALNFLHHKYYEKLKSRCPLLTADREPGSFYLRRKS